MVGLLSVSLIAALVLYVPTIGDNKACDNIGQDYYDFIDGSCIYARQLVNLTNLESAKEECQKLNCYPYDCRLPKVDSIEKHERLQDILLEAKMPDRMWFYIGLVWGGETTYSGWWQDRTKWRWISDNSTLQSFNGWISWGFWGPDDIRRCVVLWQKDTRKWRVLSWWSTSCTAMPHVSSAEGWGAPVLICESINASATTSTTSTTTTTPATTSTTTAAAKKGFSTSMWVAIGLTILLAICLIILISYHVIMCVRKRRLAKLHIRDRGDSDSTESSDLDKRGKFNKKSKTKQLGTKESCSPTKLPKKIDEKRSEAIELKSPVPKSAKETKSVSVMKKS